MSLPAPGIGELLSPRKKPPWSSWEVDFSDHAHERMDQRGLTELEVRHMLEHTRRYYRSRRSGRWLVFNQMRGVRWAFVVSLDDETRVAWIVTLFEPRESRR